MKKITLAAGIGAIQRGRRQKLMFSDLNNLAPTIFNWCSRQSKCFLSPERQEVTDCKIGKHTLTSLFLQI